MPLPRLPLPALLSRLRASRAHVRTPPFRPLRSGSGQTTSSAGTATDNRTDFSILAANLWFARAFFISHIVFSYVGVISFTSGVSMTPTIYSNYYYQPFILVSHWYRRGRGIRVGDVISFEHPMIRRDKAAKRVIGMPGDFVSVLTPGKRPEQLEDMDAVGGELREEIIQVPEGHCWIAGDNLDWSRDSRVYGPVPLALVKGKVVAILWPWDCIGWVKNALVDPVDVEPEWRLTK